MDLAVLQPSRIVAVARAARSGPDTERRCFGESTLRLCFTQARPRMERVTQRLRAGLQAR